MRKMDKTYKGKRGSYTNPRLIRESRKGYYIVDERGKRIYVDTREIEGGLQWA
jgi:hypothetical protein